MDIVIASSAPPDLGSGIGNYAKELSEALISFGHTIHYLSPSPQNYSWLEQNRISHLRSDQFDDPSQRCCELIEYFKINNIHAAINNDNPFLQSIAPALDCPLISVGHMDRKSVAALACFGWQWIDYIVAISYDMHNVFTNKYGVPNSRCPIIFNGVKNRLTFGQPFSLHTPLKVIYSGGLSRNKGAYHILSVIKKSAALWGKFELLWFGDCKPSIRKAISLHNNIQLRGRVDRNEFLDALASSDVILLPSRYEGCPMVLMEAMSLGVVPISSDGHGAMRWVIEHGINGYVCNLKKWPSQALECLAELNKNPTLLIQMKYNARKRYENALDISTTAHHLINLIKSPTVRRDKKNCQIDILKWHRPLRSDGTKAPLSDRLYIRLGILKRAGKLRLVKG